MQRLLSMSCCYAATTSSPIHIISVTLSIYSTFLSIVYPSGFSSQPYIVNHCYAQPCHLQHIYLKK